MNSLRISVIIVIFASTALAHDGVQNAIVKARMGGMSAIAENMKVLGMMAKGATEFNASDAQGALAAIAEHAAKTPTLFEQNETDPKSEAKPIIWKKFAEFSQIAYELERQALELSNTIQSGDDVGIALGKLGATCKSCHSVYRE